MTSLGNIFGNSYGSIGDARALSDDEIYNLQLQNAQSMQQAVFPAEYYRGLSNYRTPDPRTLDERFADFKARLAAAIARRAK